MKNYIIGSVKKILYENDTNGYKVGLFKVNETNDEELKDFINKTITFTGIFGSLDMELDYIFYGNKIFHQRYGEQFNCESYEVKAPTDTDGIIMYLSSGIFKGIGIKTAKKLVDAFGEDTIKVIKEDYKNVLNVSGMNERRAKALHMKLNDLDKDQELIINLNSLGFSTKESLILLNKYKGSLKLILEDNMYLLLDDVPFTKLDNIYLRYNDEKSENRINALIPYVIDNICYKTGNTLISIENLYLTLNKFFNSRLDLNEFNMYFKELLDKHVIYQINDFVMLASYFECEKYIASRVKMSNNITNVFNKTSVVTAIKEYEVKNNIVFNTDQREAILGAILKNFFIISGGPGTGKTTIIKAIIQIYKSLCTNVKAEDFALLAPTGRAAKRLSESTKIGASTIHKFLKWNKETENFSINEENKTESSIVIVDEASMIDIFLLESLLRALKDNVKIILVGDSNQLPSIAPGNVLFDLLNTEYINKKYLNEIYRVKEGSYLIDFAGEIKNQKVFKSFDKYSDFEFIESNDISIKSYLTSICDNIKKNKINLDDFQVLAPMYKGENGIDNLNILMQSIFNPSDEYKNEFKIGETTYRENDKVMELVNDVDNNIFNGDIGYIKSILKLSKGTIVEIDFMGNVVEYKNGDFDKFTHAYAISVHKSQGSEYDNVVVILSNGFRRMFYNKLIYTAVTRAKKNLILIGTVDNINTSVRTLYSSNRMTELKEFLKV